MSLNGETVELCKLTSSGTTPVISLGDLVYGPLRYDSIASAKINRRS